MQTLHKHKCSSRPVVQVQVESPPLRVAVCLGSPWQVVATMGSEVVVVVVVVFSFLEITSLWEEIIQQRV